VFKKIFDWVTNISVTGIAITAVEKINFIWKPIQEVDTSELQSAIERQSTPVIRSRGVEVESIENHGTTFDFLRVKLQNNGEGVAQNLYVKPELTVTDGNRTRHVDVEDVCILTGNDGIEIGTRYFQLTRFDEDPDANFSGHYANDTKDGGVLHPRDGVVTFSAQIELERVERTGETWDSRTRLSIPDATRMLYNAGYREMWFKIYVLYTDLNENVHVEQVLGKSGEFHGGVSLSDIESFTRNIEGGDQKVHQRIEETFRYPPP
jgi:hypothetical protein